MSNDGTTEPDPATEPVDPTHRLDSLKAIRQLPDTPAPDGWRNAILGRFGLAASVLVHLCLALWAIGWLASPQKPVEEEVIPVTIVPEEEAPKPNPPSPPENSSQKNPPRASNPSAASKPPAEPLPPRPTPPSPSPPPPSAAPADLSDMLASLGIAADSRPTTLSKEELDAVKAQAKRCWKIPSGWTEPRQISVTIRFQLNPDGSLKGSPSVVAFPASQLGKEAATNAVRAVTECGPFKLPADKYDQWNDIQLRFEP